MRKVLLLLSVCIFIRPGISLASESASEYVERGNYFYNNGEYIGAVEAYNQLIVMGYRNADVFYNLGNAYYQNKQIGRALLNYKRALRLAPRDKDIRFNYNYVNSLVSTDVEESMRDFFIRVFSYFTIDELTLFVSSGYIFLMFFIYMRYLYKREMFLWFSALFAMVLILNLGIFLFRLSSESPRLALAVENNQARNGPGGDYSVGFYLPDGKEVEIIDEHENWYAINLKKEGLKGWVERDSVEEIGID